VKKSALSVHTIFKTIAAVFGSLLTRLYEALFPDSCVLCGSLITVGDDALCSHCKRKIPGELSIGTESDTDRFIFYDQYVSLYIYSSELLKLIYSFKNGGRQNLSRFFLSSISLDQLPHFDLITYVPSSKQKLKKRGFCHTQLLACALSHYSQKPCRLLIREKKRRQQKAEHFDGRFLNTIGAFVYIAAILHGERVLLIDDILTTGATVNECSRILKKNGAGTVLSLTISRVPVKYKKKNGLVG